ncbi:MAG: hypothetical protein KDA65_11120 [Planctomycetaceae bacterium]|nr:hypothetical protein [Planctomycetaceae bacterium]
MFDWKTRCGLSLSLILSCLFLVAVPEVRAAEEKQKVQQTGGFLPVLPPSPSSSELEKQEDLWILDVAFKPMRMLPLELTNPKTGNKERRNVWYLVYKVRNVPLERPQDTSDQTPINTEDQRRIGQIFVPEFELVTHDNDRTQAYRDEILPEAVSLIAKRERLPLQSSIAIAGDLEKTDSNEYRYGVAIWTGIDPNTDFFTLYASGFSSAYRINPENGSLQKRTIMLEYARPGDKYEEIEKEFRPKDDPEWIYRPAEMKVDQTASK